MRSTKNFGLAFMRAVLVIGGLRVALMLTRKSNCPAGRRKMDLPVLDKSPAQSIDLKEQGWGQ